MSDSINAILRLQAGCIESLFGENGSAGILRMTGPHAKLSAQADAHGLLSETYALQPRAHNESGASGS